MVKSVLGVNHQGVREWIIQRLSAVLMAIYVAAIFFFLMLHPNLSFAEWHHFFSHPVTKIATLLVFTSLLYHAWVGMWTVFTDYIPFYPLRAFINFIVLILLFACFFWALLLFWSV